MKIWVKKGNTYVKSTLNFKSTLRPGWCGSMVEPQLMN